MGHGRNGVGAARWARRRVLRETAGAVALAAASARPAVFQPAAAETAWRPERPIRMVVPFAPGGVTDSIGRLSAEWLSNRLGQPVVVENRAGASGNIGAQAAAQAAPDGYTLHLGAQTLAVNMTLAPIKGFDPTKDFEPIMLVATAQDVLMVPPDSQFRTVRELIDYAKANPGKIKYGTPGTGTSLHIGMEQIAKHHGIKWTHVPFKGAAETNAALLGGHVHAVADSTGWGALVNSGDFRLLVTWGATRTKNWPNVPTLKETGLDLVANSPYGVAGPKGMDPKVVKVLHDAFRKAVDEPTYRAALEKFDQELAYLNTEDYAKHAAQQIEEAKKLVEELSLKTN
jgi:tripartite-type tricarboxylate transporter receptor subunit TctC